LEPVVALETAVLTHGLPSPTNLETVRAQSGAVREAGAAPAVVAVWHGELAVGLSDEELAELSQDDRALKVNVQNLAAACAAGASGGATVSVTMHAARLAGIDVMATGGIGGVHFITTHDVSSDIAALASIPMLVVCSGPKAVLDIEATLELLETHGVPLIGYGVDDVPAFYSRASGYPTTARADTPADAARLFHTHRSLGIPVAMMLCQPPPAELAIPPDEVEAAVWQAATAAKQQGIRGSALTPALLSAMSEHFGERALAVNTRLLVANARLAAEVAVAMRG
jgi:pseudouridine-5'-phosphate glycosidase